MEDLSFLRDNLQQQLKQANRDIHVAATQHDKELAVLRKESLIEFAKRNNIELKEDK
jgi:hypothetical protein